MTYTYERTDGTRFEHFASIKSAPLTKCPTTGQKCWLVITGGAGTVFKGGGWADKK
jgi:predicted nucleic acid-binding Zn ribbon protein